MNNFWSENVQGVQTLYLSRKLRFHDIFMNQYVECFNLDKEKKIKILEIGCGPGALAGALHRWYPNAEIVAIDRDSKFIEFAKQNETGIEFVEGDATCLPFENDTFDVTISNTVSEHIEPSIFYSEQERVLKKNGVCLVLSARKNVNHEAECLKETEKEQKFWESVAFDRTELEIHGVGKYWETEQELPSSMERNGFTDVMIGYATIPLTPDNSILPHQVSVEIIESNRKSAIEAVMSTNRKDVDKVCHVINSKYDKRLELLRKGDKQWDTYTATTMIVRGVKADLSDLK